MTVAQKTSVTIPTDQLVDRLAAAVRVAMTNPGVYVHGVRWHVAGGQLALEVVGSDISMRTTITVPEQDDATFTLPAKTALDFAKSLSGLSATFTLDDHTVEVVSGPVSFSMKLMRDDSIPMMPSPEGGEPVVLPADVLRASIAKVEKCAAREAGARPIATGVHVVLDGDRLSMDATDAYRLATKDLTLEHSTATAFDAVIPHRTLGEIAKLAEGDDEVQLRIADGRLVAAAGSTTIVSRLLDGQYPNVRQLFQATPLETRLPTKEFGAALRRMLVAKSEEVRLSFTTGEVTLSAQSVDVGRVAEAIPVPWSHDDFEIAFAIEYLRGGIDLIDEPTTIMRLAEPQRPVVLTGDGDDTFRYLVMPRRIA